MYPVRNTKYHSWKGDWVFPEINFKLKNNIVRRDWDVDEKLFGYGYWDDSNYEPLWISPTPEFIAWCSLMESIRLFRN